MPRAAIRLAVSLAMSLSVYGAVAKSPRWMAAKSGAGRSVQVRRQSDITIVEAHHEKAAIDQLLAEVLRPAEELPAETHDEQHRWVGRVAEGFIGDRDIALEER